MKRTMISTTMIASVIWSSLALGQTVHEPEWGFSFRASQGWTCEHDASGAILGHSTIPGMMLVIPHTAGSVDELKSLMAEGLQEEGVSLSLSGKVNKVENKVLSGSYQGVYGGQEVRAKGYGVISSNGGGAYVIALCTPEGYGERLDAAADALLRSVRFDKPRASGMSTYLIGTWVTMTQSTETTVTLGGNGQFYTNYVASYSGTESGDWGLAREDNSAGYWTARGSREQGNVTLRYKNGKEETIQYRVHTENGEVYWNEYWFNGTLYGRRRSN